MWKAGITFCVIHYFIRTASNLKMFWWNDEIPIFLFCSSEEGLNFGWEEVGKVLLGKAGLDVLINLDLPLCSLQLPGHREHLIHHTLLVLLIYQPNQVRYRRLELILADQVVPKIFGFIWCFRIQVFLLVFIKNCEKFCQEFFRISRVGHGNNHLQNWPINFFIRILKCHLTKNSLKSISPSLFAS